MRSRVGGIGRDKGWRWDLNIHKTKGEASGVEGSNKKRSESIGRV